MSTSEWFDLSFTDWKQRVIQTDQELGTAPPAILARDVMHGMLSGRLLLLSHFAHQRRRYIVACQPRSNSVGLVALTPREAQAVSLAMDACYPDQASIACAMSSTKSTIATHLARAMRKLGVHSRAELIAVLRALSIE